VKIVGLKIEKGRVAASIVEKGFRQTELKDSFSLAFSTDTELVDILREKSRAWVGAHIISSIPGHQFSQRTVTLPFSDRKRVEKALPFELEDTVPFSLEDMEFDHLVLDRPGAGPDKKKATEVLGFMVPRTVLQQHLDLLASAGVDPQVVVPSFAGLSLIAKMIPVEGCVLFIDSNDLCLKNGSAVLAYRSFSSLQPTGGIRHTIKALEIEHAVQIEKVYLLSRNERVLTEFADLGIAVEQIEPDFKGKKILDPVSLGLALSGQLNLRKGVFAYHREDEGSRKRRNTLIIAGAVALVLFAVNVGVKYYVVQSSYEKLDSEIRDIYRQTFPNAKTAVDPLRQLRTRLDEARKKFGVLGSGTSALDVMKAVTDGVPPEVRVSFQNFQLEGDRLKLAGEVASFESVDKLKAKLQEAKPFAEVQVPDTRKGVGDKVKFRMEIKIKQTL
jgi:general secretion pathway protein L